jgi:hypothetical protein
MLKLHMRASAVSIALTALFLAAAPIAVTSAQAVEAPKENAVFEAYSPRTGLYTELERVQHPSGAMQGVALGYGGVATYFTFGPSHSPVRFRTGEAIKFVMFVSSFDPNIPVQITFCRVQVDKGKDARSSLVYGASSPFGFKAKARDPNESTVPITAAAYEGHFIVVSPAQELPPGEYMINGLESKSLYAFGIDP